MPTPLRSPADGRELKFERIFRAPRERVWRAFTEPQELAQWWGRGNRLVVERHELTPGGHWRFVEHVDAHAYGFEGRFREIRPPERLSMTFEWDGSPGHVVVDTHDFEDLADGRTRLCTTALFMTAEDRNAMQQAGMVEGMAQSYAALDRLLATG